MSQVTYTVSAIHKNGKTVEIGSFSGLATIIIDYSIQTYSKYFGAPGDNNVVRVEIAGDDGSLSIRESK